MVFLSDDFFFQICIFCVLLCKLLGCVMLVARTENGKLYFVKYKNLAHVHNRWISEAEIAAQAPELVSKFNWRMQKEKVSLHIFLLFSLPVHFFFVLRIGYIQLIMMT
jgi:Chromo (CHRromatin Organisation MOdifier) domain